jgi:hypothetical protein
MGARHGRHFCPRGELPSRAWRHVSHPFDVLCIPKSGLRPRCPTRRRHGALHRAVGRQVRQWGCPAAHVPMGRPAAGGACKDGLHRSSCDSGRACACVRQAAPDARKRSVGTLSVGRDRFGAPTIRGQLGGNPLPRFGRHRRTARHATARRPLPPRSRQALPAHGQARAGQHVASSERGLRHRDPPLHSVREDSGNFRHGAGPGIGSPNSAIRPQSTSGRTGRRRTRRLRAGGGQGSRPSAGTARESAQSSHHSLIGLSCPRRTYARSRARDVAVAIAEDSPSDQPVASSARPATHPLNRRRPGASTRDLAPALEISMG